MTNDTPTPTSKPAKKKLLHIEFLRFLCIWLVMFTHSATEGFSIFIHRPESRCYALYHARPHWVKTPGAIFLKNYGAQHR